jgi:hypothetical protein
VTQAATGRSPRRHATVVAYLGADKPSRLADAARLVADLITRELGDAFVPRPLRDVHATIIGLEGAGPLTSGRELDDLLHLLPHADTGLLDHLATVFDRDPLTVRFGVDDREFGFTSRGLPLFERSVALSGDKIVMVGWPIDDTSGVPVDRLDGVRRGAQRFGVTHRYHQDPGSTDPDVYLVLGELIGDLDPATSARAVERARAGLAVAPSEVELGPGQLSLVFYEDTRLPEATTTAVPLRRAARLSRDQR